MRFASVGKLKSARFALPDEDEMDDALSGVVTKRSSMYQVKRKYRQTVAVQE